MGTLVGAPKAPRLPYSLDWNSFPFPSARVCGSGTSDHPDGSHTSGRCSTCRQKWSRAATRSDSDHDCHTTPDSASSDHQASLKLALGQELLMTGGLLESITGSVIEQAWV